MSPPIRDGSGSSIGSIRLGDGSEISEVRTGAGDVLFLSASGSVVEDFEASRYDDQGLSLSDRFGGDLTKYSRQQQTVLEGSFSLEHTGSSGGQVISDTGPTLTQGDTIRFDAQARNGVDLLIAIFTQNETSTPGGYALQLRPNDNTARLWILDGSGNLNTLFVTQTGALTTGTKYTLEIDTTTSGTLTGKVLSDNNGNTLSGSTTDTTYTSGGIGFYSVGGSGFVDNIRVK
jgi:hypothetical protein